MGILPSRPAEAPESSAKKWEAERLNDSLFELYKPKEAPKMQIVFFHGLQLGDYSQAHMSSWESLDGSLVWPQTWLAEEFPRARVLSVSCNDDAGNPRADMDTHLVGENLIFDLLQAEIGQVPFCPVVLVGHSIGGLVIKQVCVQAHEKLHMSRDSEASMLKKFFDNLKGIFYYATPHHGLHPIIYKLADRIHNPYFKVLSTDVTRLSFRFDSLREVHKDWMLAGLGESRPTKTGPLSGMLVVPEASSRGENYNVVEGADHFSICKPATKTSRGFFKLKGFLEQIARNSELELEKIEQAEARQRSASTSHSSSINRTASINSSASISSSADIDHSDRHESMNYRRSGFDRSSADIDHSDRHESMNYRSSGFDRPSSMNYRSAGFDRPSSMNYRSAGFDRPSSMNYRSAGFDRPSSMSSRSAYIDRIASMSSRGASSDYPVSIDRPASTNSRTPSIDRIPSDKKDKEESSSGRNDLQEELPARAEMDIDAFEWYDDPLTWDKMCDPVNCSDGRTYDRWTIVDQKLRRAPYDSNIPDFRILTDDLTTRSRLFKAFPEQELKFRQRRKAYREEALRHARAHPIEYENAVEKLENVLQWRPLDEECQRELHKIKGITGPGY